MNCRPKLCQRLAATLKSVMAVLVPQCCAICGRRLSPGERGICSACTVSLPYTRFGARRNNPVERLFIGRFPLGRATSYIFYNRGTDTRNMLFALKYYRRPEIGTEFGRRIATELKGEGFFNGTDMIVPMPLARKRERHRGYNQSLMLARGIAEITGITVDGTLLVRTVDNPTQTMRTPQQRIENVAGIFRTAHEEKIKGKHILLVDDVVTTGATLTACADKLAEAGAETISILTLATSPSTGLW